MLNFLSSLIFGPDDDSHNEMATRNLAVGELEDAKAMPSRKRRRHIEALIDRVGEPTSEPPHSQLEEQLRTLFGTKQNDLSPIRYERDARKLAGYRPGGRNTRHEWGIDTQRCTNGVQATLYAVGLRNDQTPVITTAPTTARAITRAVLVRETLTMSR